MVKASRFLVRKIVVQVPLSAAFVCLKKQATKEWQGNTKSLLASYLCKESFSAWDLQANTFFIDPIYNKNSRSYHLVYEHGVSATTPSGLPAGRGWLLMMLPPCSLLCCLGTGTGLASLPPLLSSQPFHGYFPIFGHSHSLGNHSSAGIWNYTLLRKRGDVSTT